MPAAIPRSVAVIGGGLAGLSCALSLGRAGFDVTVYESSDALGGKAGVRTEEDLLNPGRDFPLPSEHGPHFVTGWYRNLLSLAGELGVADRLVHYSGLTYLLATASSAATPRKLELSARAMPRLLAPRIGSGSQERLSTRGALQLGSMALDLITNIRQIESEPDRSLAAYLDGRWYCDEGLAEIASEQVLRASAIPAEEVSVRTVARMMALWFAYPRPFLSVFDEDLVSAFVAPLARAVESVARIRLRAPITGLLLDDRGRAVGVCGPREQRFPADLVVAAVPIEAIRSWGPGALPAGELERFADLRSAPMCSIQLVFDGVLRGIPAGVFYLWGSQPAINGIDLSQTWRSLTGRERTVFSLVLSDYEEIRDLGDRGLVELILGQLRRYIPDAARVNLASAVVRTNSEEPLFINTAGSWSARPRPCQPYGGSLYVIGDYARTAVDLACMEGAVLAGLEAAAAISERASRPPGLTALPAEDPTWFRRCGYGLAKAGLGPLTALAVRR